jgi:hypothetical protein
MSEKIAANRKVRDISNQYCISFASDKSPAKLKKVKKTTFMIFQYIVYVII